MAYLLGLTDEKGLQLESARNQNSSCVQESRAAQIGAAAERAGFSMDKTLASERRARRERARFSGSSGAGAASLGVERNL
jgi:hypothetical protein